MSIMIEKNKITISWGLRALLAFMFLFSAYAKLYPSPYFALTTFEVKQLIPMGFSANSAAYFSRILIGCEFALGIGLLQPHFLKKVVIPLSILILVIFIGELFYEIATTGNKGSCGCFGALLPMTPLEAIIKNIVGAGLLIWLYPLMKDVKDEKNFYVITTIAFAAILAVFLVGPMSKTSTSGEEVVMEEVVVEEPKTETPATVENPRSKPNVVTPTTTPKDEKGKKTEPEKEVKPVVDEVPAAKKSGYASVFSDIDDNHKILCFFAPGCEHCQQTVKELTQLKKSIPDFPEIRIAFMDEETELIPHFFEIAGQKYTYKVLDIATFWTKLGNGKDTPGVFYFWNGNLIKEYNGIDANKFDKDGFKKIVQKKWIDLK